MELTNITDRQELSIQNYRRMGIDIEVLENNFIKITQARLINGIILNKKELHYRARKIFPDKIFKIIPVVYSPNLKEITQEWIYAKMDEFGIKRKDLAKQLSLDSSYLSLLFADKSNPRKINFSKPMKALFFYYFLSYELNRDLRAEN